MAEDPAVAELLDLVPALRGERTVTELAGGLTNTNYKVVTAEGAYVMRVSAKDAGMLAIDRENEYRNSVSAADAGVGARVVDYLPDRSLLVLEFIEGTTQTADDLRRGDKLEMVAQVCRRLHGAAPFRDDFNMFRIQRRYLELVQERGFRLPPRYVDFEPQVRRMETAMGVRDEGTVPCNNDLLAENFIDTGAGEFRLIDYEYSGMNDACFELGNVWSESNLSLDQLDELVTHYYGRLRRSRIARARLWGLMSKYGWTLWASIQDGVSDIDFDFWEWGIEKYDRAVAEFDGPDFEGLLEAVVLED
ncbi:MAG TPA: choline/ethanolamine kinase family protein [Gaiellales bacterium]